MITERQAEYRAYLASPVWKAKRGEALAFYGCICNRCAGYGNEVHHKTYERVGGTELMSDLEVMCRECHQAHHRNRDKRTRTRNPGIPRGKIMNKLTDADIKYLEKRFPGERIKYAVELGNPFVAKAAAKLLGYRYAYGHGMRETYTPKCVKHHLNSISQKAIDYGFTKEFKKFSQLDKKLFDKWP